MMVCFYGCGICGYESVAFEHYSRFRIEENQKLAGLIAGSLFYMLELMRKGNA